MPLTPEEPQIYESIPGPSSAAGSAHTSEVSHAASVPGQRSAAGSQSAEGRGARARSGGRAGGRSSGRRGQSATSPAAQNSARIDLREASDATAVEVADDVVDSLLDEGRAPSEVLVLTTGDAHPWTEHELSFGQDAYWRQQTEGDDVFFAEARSSEHLRSRAVVVLAVNGGTDEAAGAALPAALGLAHEVLIVCGDPQRLRALL